MRLIERAGGCLRATKGGFGPREQVGHRRTRVNVLGSRRGLGGRDRLVGLGECVAGSGGQSCRLGPLDLVDAARELGNQGIRIAKLGADHGKA